MKHISKLTGRALLAYGETLASVATEARKHEGVHSDGLCPTCGTPLPIKRFTLEELSLESHPNADKNGVIEIHAPCQTPECQELREKHMDQLRRSEDRQGRDSMAARLERAGIQYLGGMTFDQFDAGWPKQARHRQALLAMQAGVQEWARDPKGILILSGPYGTGKSHLAVSTLHMFLAQNNGSAFHFACCEGWDALKVSWDEKIVQYRGRMLTRGDLTRRCNECRVLVLDDFDKIIPSDGWYSWIFPIINYRGERQLPMVLTVNHPVNELYSYMITSNKMVTWEDRAAALFDRLSRAQVLELSADQPSYRGLTQ